MPVCSLLGTHFFHPLFSLDKAANIKIIINLSVEQTMTYEWEGNCLFSDYFNYLFGNIARNCCITVKSYLKGNQVAEIFTNQGYPYSSFF